MNIKEVSGLIRHFKESISGDESLQFTIGFDDSGDWDFQSGSNEFSGPCYRYKNWECIWIDRYTNCYGEARSLVRSIKNRQSKKN